MSLNVVPKVMWARLAEYGAWEILSAVSLHGPEGATTHYFNQERELVDLEEYDSFSCYDSFEDA